jgi:hypothetical protein
MCVNRLSCFQLVEIPFQRIFGLLSYELIHKITLENESGLCTLSDCFPTTPWIARIQTCSNRLPCGKTVLNPFQRIFGLLSYELIHKIPVENEPSLSNALLIPGFIIVIIHSMYSSSLQVQCTVIQEYLKYHRHRSATFHQRILLFLR